ncbi:hypothetical protein M3G54_01605 [Brevibacterium casei]|uniref:hypothetical protein n=1 Tax=Brevibacterium casei TaxID=33889 RepID=UPI00223A6E29|nr:hypothetical protein [Brevibacterium casei]MCT2357059.1 hypothetical protein [Brevibacterium casei]
MSEYRVVYEGRVREIYIVEAENEAEARERWSDFEPEASDVFDGEIVEVTQDES